MLPASETAGDGCRAFGELMVEHGEGGHIVNLSSAAAGIDVSTICPGIVKTNITASSAATPPPRCGRSRS